MSHLASVDFRMLFFPLLIHLIVGVCLVSCIWVRITNQPLDTPPSLQTLSRIQLLSEISYKLIPIGSRLYLVQICVELSSPPESMRAPKKAVRSVWFV